MSTLPGTVDQTFSANWSVLFIDPGDNKTGLNKCSRFQQKAAFYQVKKLQNPRFFFSFSFTLTRSQSAKLFILSANLSFKSNIIFVSGSLFHSCHQWLRVLNIFRLHFVNSKIYWTICLLTTWATMNRGQTILYMIGMSLFVFPWHFYFLIL